MMNTVKRFWALCLDRHMKLALYKYAIIIIIIICIQHTQMAGGHSVTTPLILKQFLS